MEQTLQESQEKRGSNEGSDCSGQAASKNRVSFHVYFGIFGLVFLLLIPLILINKSSEVTIDLKVSEVLFVIDGTESVNLINAVHTPSLTLLNFEQVDLGAGLLESLGVEFSSTISSPDFTDEGYYLIEGLNESPGGYARLTLNDVRIDEISVSPQTSVTVATVDEGQTTLKFRIQNRQARGRLVVDDNLTFTSANSKITKDNNFLPLKWGKFRFKGKRSRSISFKGGKEWTTVAFDTEDKDQFNPLPIYIDRLAFTKRKGNTMYSSVLGERSKIIFPGLKNKEVPVAEKDFVIVEDLKKFFIKNIAVDRGICLSLHGKAGVLKTGPAEDVKNRLPSILEWIYAQHRWLLLLQATAGIASLILGILDKWKSRKEIQ